MRIVDTWKQDNDILAYCIGVVDAGFSCEEISVNDKSFSVTGVDVLTSVAGGRSVVLRLAAKTPKEVPLGDVVVVQ